MANAKMLEMEMFQRYPGENKEEIKGAVAKAIELDPTAPDEVIIEKLEKTAEKVKAQMPQDQMREYSFKTAPQAPAQIKTTYEPIPSVPSNKPGLSEIYKSLREKYQSPNLGEAGRANAIKRAESTQTSPIRVGVGSALKSFARGLNPAMEGSGEYQARIASRDKGAYDKVIGEFDKKKDDIVTDAKNISNLGIAEVNAQSLDPDSEISGAFRAFLGKMAPGMAGKFDNMSAVQMGKLFPEAKTLFMEKNKNDLANLAAKTSRRNAQTKAKNTLIKPSQSENTFDAESTKKYVKKIEILPRIASRLRNIDRALDIVRKFEVDTGPISGMTVPYFLKKLSNTDAQTLEYYLATENVEKIMEFASKAGVRAIDTPSEQKRLLDSIGNKKMDASVLIGALFDMKDTLAASERSINAETEYRNKPENRFSSRGFVPPKFKGRSEFPKKVFKGSKVTTVENQAEYDEAINEGWQ